jgi:hypothetical protein
MKLSFSGINFSDFTEGKEIQDIEIQDYSLPDFPTAFYVSYYPNIKKLLVIKTTKNSAENAAQYCADFIEYAILYPLQVTETENA